MVVTSRLHSLFDQLRVNLAATYAFHHGEMFEIVVSLEEGIPGEEFHQNAADTPDVAWEAPTQIEDNLRSSVVPGGHHG